MSEKKSVKMPFAPPCPEDYILASPASPLVPGDEMTYWVALASHDLCPLGVLIYEPGRIITFLAADEAITVLMSLLNWLPSLKLYLSQSREEVATLENLLETGREQQDGE